MSFPPRFQSVLRVPLRPTTLVKPITPISLAMWWAIQRVHGRAFRCAGNNSIPFLVHQHSCSRDAVLVRALPSDALALRSDRLDPIRERLHELLQEFAGAVAD